MRLVQGAYMWRDWPRLAGLLIALAAAISCGEDELRDEPGRPTTFGDQCMLGADFCKDPFVCLNVPDFSEQATGGAFCTTTCQQNEDCPAWQESTGPCSGAQQSQCVRLICRDPCP